ncbi:MAG: flagellar filament capping protein FliD [Lachnospiraceae bacterium]|nr:flagellar filament capping protein FliD [Lachnospiraceae bacterium]
MSSINFNDYVNYANYDSGYDVSALLGGGSNAAGNIISDYASIKNGSYGKLMKAYYAKQDAEKGTLSGDSRQKLTLMRSNADSLKKSADALNDSSLWEKKKFIKKDEETGEEIEVEDYDWDAITKAVKSFVEDYNAVVGQAGDSDTKNILRNASWMTGITESTQKLLSAVGINIGKGNKLQLDEDALKEANVDNLKSLFTGHGSYADRISQKADRLSHVAANTVAGAKVAAYTSNGGYSDTLSKLFSSTVDEKIGNKDKNSETYSKNVYKKEDKDKYKDKYIDKDKEKDKEKDKDK